MGRQGGTRGGLVASGPCWRTAAPGRGGLLAARASRRPGGGPTAWVHPGPGPLLGQSALPRRVVGPDGQSWNKSGPAGQGDRFLAGRARGDRARPTAPEGARDPEPAAAAAPPPKRPEAPPETPRDLESSGGRPRRAPRDTACAQARLRKSLATRAQLDELDAEFLCAMRQPRPFGMDRPPAGNSTSAAGARRGHARDLPEEGSAWRAFRSRDRERASTGTQGGGGRSRRGEAAPFPGRGHALAATASGRLDARWPADARRAGGSDGRVRAAGRHLARRGHRGTRRRIPGGGSVVRDEDAVLRAGSGGGLIALSFAGARRGSSSRGVTGLIPGGSSVRRCASGSGPGSIPAPKPRS